MTRAHLVAAAALLGAAQAHAARPMVTDDARIVDAKACQLEAWTRRNADSEEYWALPACNFTGNLEITFGGARTHDAHGSAFTDQVMQGKTILRALQPDGWGAGFTLGAARRVQGESANRFPGDPYFNVPVSLSMAGDAWVAHFNGGAAYRKDEKRTVATWGFGNEVRLRHDLYLIPEIFRNEPGKPFYQAGLRYWIVKDRVQMDATYGERFGSQGRHWISIGLRLLTPPFIR